MLTGRKTISLQYLLFLYIYIYIYFTAIDDTKYFVTADMPRRDEPTGTIEYLKKYHTFFFFKCIHCITLMFKTYCNDELNHYKNNENCSFVVKRPYVL